MKIQNKLTLAFTAISLTSVCALILIFNIHSNTATRQILQHLEAIATIQKHRVQSIVENDLEKLLLVTNQSQLRESLANFAREPLGEHREKMNLFLRDAISPLRGLKEISLLDLNGMIVASTDAAHIGHNHSGSDFFVAGKKDNYVDVFSLHGGEPERIYFIGPVLKDTQLLGVAIIEADLESVTSSVMDYSGLGKTGETVLAKRNRNGDALFLMPLRFDTDAALKRVVISKKDNVAITQALLKNEDLFTEYFDYRGNPVIAATRYIESVDWGLVVKIDKEEAFASIRLLKFLLILALIITSFSAIAVSLYSSRRIAGPIVRLTQMAERISQGDLRQRIDVQSNDEVGTLSDTFNKMAVNIRESLFSRDYVESIFASMMDALLVIDLSCREGMSGGKALIVKANYAACRMLGYTMDELTGMACQVIFRAEKESADGWIEELLQKESVTGEEKTVMSKDGTMIPVLLSASLTWDREGKTENMICVLHDITRHKESEETLKNIATGVSGLIGKDFFNSLVQYLSRMLNVENVQIAEIVSRKEGKARTIAACQNGKVIENYEYLLSGTPCERVWNSGLCFFPGGIVNLFPKDTMLKEMGAECYLGAPLIKSDGSAFGLMAIIGRRRMESPYIPVAMVEIFAVRAAAELERLQMEEELIRAKEDALEATKIKDKFVTLVAHDLKSPFASILGFLNLIYDDKQEILAPKHRPMVSRAINSGNNLIQMIDGLLKIARLQTGKISLNKKFFDVSFAALSTIGNYSLLARGKGLVLESKIPPFTMIYGDMDLIREVIDNLVSNAIKFCNEGDRVTIFIPEGEKAVIAVRDTGIGIDPKAIPNLFRQDIKTTTKGTRGEKGTGLGLPLCHDIVKALDGSLTLETSKDGGTAFYINLPEVRPKVLIVDDDELFRMLAMKFLGGADIEFMEADSGAAAVRMLEEQTPHLIISDIKMPGMDGLQLLDYVHGIQKLQSIPFIVITNDSSIETRKAAFYKGASDFVVKPLKAEEFIPRVRRFI